MVTLMIGRVATRAVMVSLLAVALVIGGGVVVNPESKGLTSVLAAEEASAARVGGQCAEAAKIAWANRWNPWPPSYVVAAMATAATCGSWIGGLWGERALEAMDRCWPNCPSWAPFRFW